MLVLMLSGASALTAAPRQTPTFTTRQFSGYLGIAVSTPCLPLPRAITTDANAACSQRYDLNGDSRPEVIARQVSFDGGRPHTYAIVYTEINGRWSKVIEQEGDWLFVSRATRSHGWLDILVGVSCANEDEDSPLVCARSVRASYANGRYVVSPR